MCLAHQARRGEAHQDGDGKPHVWHQLKLSGALLQLYRRFDERVAGSQQRLVSGDAVCDRAKRTVTATELVYLQ